MKIFAAKSVARQYKIDGLSFEVDLRSLVHKLVVEIDQDVHVYYDEEKHQIRQKLIENLVFSFVRINSDIKNFELDVGIAKIYNYIQELFLKLALDSAEKSLKESFPKELLSYVSRISKYLKHI